MDENAVLVIINSLKTQIAEVKGQMREQYRQEIEQIESAHANEKALLEQKYQEEIGEYLDTISLQKGDIDLLELENGEKNDKIVQIETSLIEKDEEIGRKLEELKTKTNEYNFLQTRFDEKVEEIRRQNNNLTTKDEEIINLRTEINQIKQEKASMQTKINNKTSEISCLENDIQNKRREITNLQIEVTNAKNEYKRLNKYIEDNTVRIYNKGDYSKITYVYSGSNEYMAEDKKNYAKEITIKSFNMYVDDFERAKYITDQFESRYNGKWGVNIMIQNYGSTCITYCNRCYIKFDIGEFTVTIFKTKN